MEPTTTSARIQCTHPESESTCPFHRPRRRRELLCDRKDPYLHLTPRRLAFTVVKSGFVVAAPMINEVILENLDEVILRESRL